MEQNITGKNMLDDLWNDSQGKILFYTKEGKKIWYDRKKMEKEIKRVSHILRRSGLPLQKGAWVNLRVQENYAAFFLLFAVWSFGCNVFLAPPKGIEAEGFLEVDCSFFYTDIPMDTILDDLPEAKEWGQWLGFYSSGTTGNQKKFVYSVQTLLALLENVETKIRESEVLTLLEKNSAFDGRKILSMLPVYHILGFLTPMALIAFACEPIYCDCIGISHIVQVVREEKVIAMIGVPVLWELLYNVAKRKCANAEYPIQSILGKQLQIILSGGSKTSAVLRKAYLNDGIHFLVGYGMTELGFLTLSSSKEKDILSEGTVYSMYDYKIQTETGEWLDEGEGELFVDTGGLCSARFENGEIQKINLVDGRYFPTGDIFLLKEKQLYFRGRKKNVIVCENGENIFAEEIEEQLSSLKAFKIPYCVGEYKGMPVLYLHTFGNTITEATIKHVITVIKMVNKTLYVSSKIKKIVCIEEALEQSAKGRLLIYKLKENSALRVVDIL